MPASPTSVVVPGPDHHGPGRPGSDRPGPARSGSEGSGSEGSGSEWLGSDRPGPAPVGPSTVGPSGSRIEPRSGIRDVRRRLARPARAGLAAAARGLDVVAPAPRGIVVLSFHQVGAPRAGPVNLDLAAFADQMALLADRRATGPVIDLDHALAGLGFAPPLDPVVLTFDDGTADFVDHALPVLVRHQLPVTLYLATTFVEQGRSFWDDGTVLSWAALRDACSTGLVTIGTHTHTHALLDRAPVDVVAAELDRSIGLVQERLDQPGRHFAYPKAVAPAVGSAADAAVRARVASAAVAGGRPNPYGRTDPWRLARTPVVAADGLDRLARKAVGGLRLEGAARDRLDRVRYARAAS